VSAANPSRSSTASSGCPDAALATEGRNIAAAAEISFVYLFAGLLAFGAVLLAFVPLLHHAWSFAVSRRTFGVLAAIILIVGVGAVLLVNSAVSEPIYFVPIAGITAGLRLTSPLLLYRRIEERFDASKGWPVVRWLAVLGFLGFAAILTYHLVQLVVGSQAAVWAVLSEQIAMALGASILFFRAGLRIRPRETREAWPIWAAVVLMAIAFVVVLPYAIPAFDVVYAASGLIGWSIGIFRAVRDL
jgi:hypothetical protein